MKGWKLTILLLFIWWLGHLSAQPVEEPLFADQSPLQMRLSFSIRDVKRNTNDSTYIPSTIYFRTAGNSWDSLSAEIRVRGFYRLQNCVFPPIKIRIDKKEREGSLFEENKSVKLVVACRSGDNYGSLVLKEYLCYKLYESMTPYHFYTRWADVTLVDETGKKSRAHELKAFLVEDDDRLAKRFNAEIKDDLRIHPLVLSDTASTIHDFFQYMISNLDWSSVVQHNVKLMQLEKKAFIPLAYDFDMSGMVNAPYAVVNEMFKTKDVRERLYRGFCRDGALFQYVRSKYLAAEAEMFRKIDLLGGDLTKYEKTEVTSYLAQFFDILKDDRLFKASIIDQCRTK